MLLNAREQPARRSKRRAFSGWNGMVIGWQLQTQSGRIDADYCIVATGARNPLRDVGTQLYRGRHHVRARATTFPAQQDRIDIQFLPELEGYIWVFPRCGHLSVGICGKGEPAPSLRSALELYMEQNGIAARARRSTATCCPAWKPRLAAESRAGRAGWRWAMRPAGGSDHRRRSLLRDALGRPGGPGAAQRTAQLAKLHPQYTAGCCAAISRTIWNSVRAWPSAFFRASFCSAPCPAAWCSSRGAARASPRMMQDLFAGTQNYLGLKRRLLAQSERQPARDRA